MQLRVHVHVSTIMQYLCTVHVYMYTCVHVHMCICTHVYAHVCTMRLCTSLAYLSVCGYTRQPAQWHLSSCCYSRQPYQRGLKYPKTRGTSVQYTTSIPNISIPYIRYFMITPENQLLKHQTGVFRTNCMDCLDRTNVVQSLLARRTLQEQLQVMFGK